MRQKRGLLGVNSVLLITAAILIMPTLGSTVAKAQSPTSEDELFKPTRRIQEPLPVVVPNGPQVTSPSTPQITQQRRNVRSGRVGSGVPGSTESGGDTRIALATAAGPISSCAVNGGGGFDCNLFETDGSGNQSEISSIVTTPAGVTGGYLVLKDNPAAADSDQTQWSDVVVFSPTAGIATQIQVFSAGCNTGNPNDRSCFPSFATVTADPDSAFINETPGQATVFVADGTHSYTIFSIDDNPPVRPFTLASSVGTVDEDSASIFQLRNFTATLLPGATGSVHVRYNILAVDGAAAFCPASISVVRVRYRNSDSSGVAAKVSFEIHSTNVTSGGNNIIYTFSSNNHSTGSVFATLTQTPQIDFDFANNVYWIEATIFRSDPNAFADLGSIQIWEAGGTACP